MQFSGKMSVRLVLVLIVSVVLIIKRSSWIIRSYTYSLLVCVYSAGCVDMSSSPADHSSHSS